MIKSGRTVLVIDDTSISADTYQHQLQREPKVFEHVLTANNGEQAVLLSQAHALDCVVLKLSHEPSYTAPDITRRETASCETVSQDREAQSGTLQKPIATSYSLVSVTGEPQPEALLGNIIPESCNASWLSLEIMNQLKAALQDRCPPIVVIGGDRIELAVQAMKAGAADYLVGDRTSPDELRTAVSQAIESRAGITASAPCDLKPRDVESCESESCESESAIAATASKTSALSEKSSSELLLGSPLRDLSSLCPSLVHQQQLIEAIYQSAPIGLAILDRDLRYVRINEYLAEMNGFSMEKHLGRTVRQVLPRLADEVEVTLHEILATGEPRLGMEIRAKSPKQSESVRTWISHFVPVRHGQEVVGISAVCEEITERVRAAEALRQSEARFRNMADKAPMMVWLADIRGHCTYLSQSWYEFTGQSESITLGLGWLESVHPDDRAAVKKVFMEEMATAETLRLEYRLRHRDGRYHWVLDTAAPWFDQDGNNQGYIGSVLDISDRKQAEEALRRSEERYRLLFESMNDGFFVIQMLFDETDTPVDYQFLEVNPVFEKQTGLIDAVGKTARQILPTMENHWFERYGWVAITGEPIRFEHSSDAVNSWFDVSAFRIGPPEDRKVAILFKDVSDRKRAEQERRLVEIQREKLLVREQSAREAAERANRIKDEFLAVLSHELRSPLNPILGWTQLLRLQRLSEAETQEALSTIERNVRLQTQLIDDLLDLAKILRGKLSLNIAAVDLTAVTEAAIETVQPAADGKAIAIHATLPKVGYVSGDAARLQQVVWNLLSNGVKFTPTGGRVEIHLQRVDQQAHIVVTDTGKGISPGFLPHLFEQFHQEDASTTRKYGGLGLGLTIVRQLVEAHGGTVTATSPGEGLGATFTVTLPILLTAPETLPVQPEPSPNYDLHGVYVLAVDDEPDALELLRVLLVQHGAEVVAVRSAAEVLTALKIFRPDILISDIGMPDVDGYSLLRQIRALPPEQGGQIPAIALTAYARKEDFQRALDSGYQDHLPKPIEFMTLLQAVYALTKINND